MSAAPAVLEVARIRRTLATVRERLAEAVALLEGLYAERAWVALGLPSWEALCAEELPELGRLLELAQRKEVVLTLRRGGASLRAAAAPVGVSAATAKSWCDEAGVVLELVRSKDGALRPGTAAPARRRAVPLTDRTVALLAEAGPLTVVEVARRQRLSQHRASATLTRLRDAGRIAYAPGARRGAMGTWAAGTVNR